MIKEILQEAFLFKSKGFYKHAIEKFYKAIDSENISYELLFEIADCYFLINNDERAINYIEQILETNPIHIESLKLLKKIFTQKKAWNEAEQVAKNIYSISKKVEDLVEIFIFLNKQKKYEEIFNYNFSENHPDLFYEIAYAKFYTNDIESALAYIEKALEHKKNNKYLILKGYILLKNNSDEEAYKLIQKINLNTDDYDTLNFLGKVYQRCGEYKKSIDYFMQGLKLTQNSDECYYNCASTYFKMGDLSQAKKYYNLAISKNPEHSGYHLALANLFYAEKNYKRAYEELKDDLYESRLLKSIILFDSGYYAIAQKEFETLTKEMPNDDIVKKYLQKIEEKLRI